MAPIAVHQLLQLDLSTPCPAPLSLFAVYNSFDDTVLDVMDAFERALLKELGNKSRGRGFPANVTNSIRDVSKGVGSHRRPWDGRDVILHSCRGRANC